MRKFDARKLAVRADYVRPETSVIVEIAITTNPIHQNGLDKARPGRSGRTILDSIRTTRSSGTTAIQRYLANFSATIVHRAFGFEREIGRAMSCQHHDSENRNRNRVPIEQADMAADVEVREKRHREIAVRVSRNSARDIAGGCAEKNRKQEIGARRK